MTGFLDKFELSYNRLTEFLIALVAISIGLFTVLIPINLLLLKMQWGSLWWLNEAVEYALYVGVFIGAPWVLQQGAHVRVDVIYAMLPKAAAIQMERVLDAIGVILCLVLFIYGTRGALVEFEDGTMPDKPLSIANWYMLTVFAFSFLLLALEFAFRLRRAKSIVEEDQENPTKAAF